MKGEGEYGLFWLPIIVVAEISPKGFEKEKILTFLSDLHK